MRSIPLSRLEEDEETRQESTQLTDSYSFPILLFLHDEDHHPLLCSFGNQESLMYSRQTEKSLSETLLKSQKQ
jgi:hypothetical protein